MSPPPSRLGDNNSNRQAQSVAWLGSWLLLLLLVSVWHLKILNRMRYTTTTTRGELVNQQRKRVSQAGRQRRQRQFGYILWGSGSGWSQLESVHQLIVLWRLAGRHLSEPRPEQAHTGLQFSSAFLAIFQLCNANGTFGNWLPCGMWHV